VRAFRVTLLAACLVGASACRREAPAADINTDTTTEPAIPRIPRGPDSPSSARPANAVPGAPAATAPAWIDPMQPHPGEQRAPMVRVDEGALTTTDTVGAPAPAAQPMRDLSAELRALAGDVTGCIPLAEIAGRAQVSVELEAMVLENGTISRLTVGGAGLPPQATDCIRARLALARLNPPVAGAPRSVQARIVLDLQPAPTTAAAPESGDGEPQPLVIQQRVR
jgi:hypothetical protein